MPSACDEPALFGKGADSGLERIVTLTVERSPTGPVRRTRDRFETFDAPVKPMSTQGRLRTRGRSNYALKSLGGLIEAIPWSRERFRWALRDALDDAIDGSRTGRWCYQHLERLEQRALGANIEATLSREFSFAQGSDLAWQFAGRPAGCVFSVDADAWELPMAMYECEAHGDRSGASDAVAVLIWMSDDSSEWAVGLASATDQDLRWRHDPKSGCSVRAYSRDNTRRFSEDGLKKTHWLWGGVQEDLPRNTLLHMLPQDRGRIFADAKSGQRRVNELFRVSLGEVVRKPTLLTVAQQDDAPKRVRDARRILQPEGIVILGHQESHPAVARALGLPVPEKGEWVAIRLVPSAQGRAGPTIPIAGTTWAVARSGEQVVPAPTIPKHVPGLTS